MTRFVVRWKARFLHHARALSVPVLVFAMFASAAGAQTGIYAEFGGSKINAPSDDWIYGPTFGAYSDFVPLPFVHLGADLRGSVLGVSQNTTLYSGMIGPRLSVHPHVLPVSPYLEAVFGIGHYDYGSNGGSDTKFEYQFLGGIDHTVIPRLDWRVIEFSYGGLSAFGSSIHPKTISTGLVLRLP
jgi:hypothetical protein